MTGIHREPWDDDEPESYPDEFEEDEIDEAMGRCGLHRSGGVWVCGHVGSEDCDFECPFRGEVGKRR